MPRTQHILWPIPALLHRARSSAPRAPSHWEQRTWGTNGTQLHWIAARPLHAMGVGATSGQTRGTSIRRQSSRRGGGSARKFVHPIPRETPPATRGVYGNQNTGPRAVPPTRAPFFGVRSWNLAVLRSNLWAIPHILHRLQCPVPAPQTLELPGNRRGPTQATRHPRSPCPSSQFASEPRRPYAARPIHTAVT
eukprot:8282019-Alexandrium_andersonii.AAC.1